MITIFLGLMITLPALQQQTPASPPAPAQQAINRQPLSSSDISRLRTKADAGDSRAQSALGEAYWTGNGVPHSDETASTWFKKAADQHDADAENALGTMYRRGEGVPKDRDEALRWYHKAAKDGSAAAMFNLGAAYYNGDGVTIDDLSSCSWFLLAQEAGYPQATEAVRRATAENSARPTLAAEKIGEMYFKGGELPKDQRKALMWFRRAADGGVHEAQVNIASLLVNGPHPTVEEYSEARTRCEDAAKTDYGPGAFCMAVIYKRGLGVAENATESTQWLARAANLGHPKAMRELGEAYWKGVGVKPDLVTAYMWVWRAYKLQTPGAETEEEELRKQMSAKDIQKARRNAEVSAAQERVPTLQDKRIESTGH